MVVPMAKMVQTGVLVVEEEGTILMVLVMALLVKAMRVVVQEAMKALEVEVVLGKLVAMAIMRLVMVEMVCKTHIKQGLINGMQVAAVVLLRTLLAIVQVATAVAEEEGIIAEMVME